VLVYGDNVNIMGGSVRRVYNKEKHRRLVIASKDIILEVNADKSKYMVISRDQNRGKGHN
jgi:hypothetical protein